MSSAGPATKRRRAEGLAERADEHRHLRCIEAEVLERAGRWPR